MNKNCFNCCYSHIFGEYLKCSLNAKNNDGSDYKIVYEGDIKPCWTESKFSKEEI